MAEAISTYIQKAVIQGTLETPKNDINQQVIQAWEYNQKIPIADMFGSKDKDPKIVLEIYSSILSEVEKTKVSENVKAIYGDFLTDERREKLNDTFKDAIRDRRQSAASRSRRGDYWGWET
ncbi:MAG: hypothetical protein ACOYJ2_08350 [Rickettsiales bacterium]